MVWTREKGGGRGVERGRGGEGWRLTASGNAKEKVEKVCDRGKNLLGIEEHMAQDCQLWKAVITHPTLPYWENVDVK